MSTETTATEVSTTGTVTTEKTSETPQSREAKAEEPTTFSSLVSALVGLLAIVRNW